MGVHGLCKHSKVIYFAMFTQNATAALLWTVLQIAVGLWTQECPEQYEAVITGSAFFSSAFLAAMPLQVP